MSVDGSEPEDKKPLICLRDLSNYRERNMPSSPLEVKASGLCSPGNQLSPDHSQHRPLSNSSNYSAGTMNGLPSPNHSIRHGSPEVNHSPSPPPALGGTMAQQLPPACGARQLSKLKRFLTTLIQFGSDISPDIGDRVRSLVLALVNNHLSVEEFHSKLQEATNFPLRPFVIPFLKANLPLLQRELLYCARLARQTPQQYLAHHEHLLFDPSHQPLTSPPSSTHNLRRMQDQRSSASVSSPSSHNVLNQNGKRPKSSPHHPKENGSLSQGELPVPPPAKRSHSSSLSPQSSPSSLTSPLLMSGSIRAEESLHQPMGGGGGGMDRSDRFFSPYVFGRPGDNCEGQTDRVEEEWKHLESMLHCIMDMVGRCRHALSAVQERVRREREDLARWIRHSGADPDVKKKADYMTESLRNAEDRVIDMRRRAVHVFPEEAVNEVKRQALLELQKAVTTAELKASELVAAERHKMERAIVEAQHQAKAELQLALTQQIESSETCWNCGRKASETCSGCNVARYCGAFCQHKDWERHHKACRPPGSSSNHSSPETTATAESSHGNSGQHSDSPGIYASPSSRHSPHEEATPSQPEHTPLKDMVKSEEGVGLLDLSA